MGQASCPDNSKGRRDLSRNKKRGAVGLEPSPLLNSELRTEDKELGKNGAGLMKFFRTLPCVQKLLSRLTFQDILQFLERRHKNVKREK